MQRLSRAPWSVSRAVRTLCVWARVRAPAHMHVWMCGGEVAAHPLWAWPEPGAPPEAEGEKAPGLTMYSKVASDWTSPASLGFTPTPSFWTSFLPSPGDGYLGPCPVSPDSSPAPRPWELHFPSSFRTPLPVSLSPGHSPWSLAKPG